MELIHHDGDLTFAGNIELAPEEIGTPAEDYKVAPGPQEQPDTCAIRCQQHILAMYGIDIPESELMQDAIAHQEYGIPNSVGTQMDDVGNLLERHGIEVHRYADATMAHLISDLGQGHKVIAGVDAYEIMADSEAERLAEMQKDAVAEIPNHALVVVSVDPRTLEVELVDPLDGHLHRIPEEQFVDAWEDSNCFMVSTTQSPEEYIESQVETQAVSHRAISSEGGWTMNSMGMHGIDLDGDRIPEIMEHDLNHDQMIEQLSIDVNEDTIPDVVIQSNPGLVNTMNPPGWGGLGHVSGMVKAESGLGGPGYAAGDGEAEIIGIDLDGDEILNVVGIDTTGDHIVDTFGIDVDNDYKLDMFAQTVDLTDDGIPDGVIVDLDGDMNMDAIGVDLDGDGNIDEFTSLN